MSDVANPLDLTTAEKRRLREHKIKVREMHLHTVGELQALLGVSKFRAMELYALSEFQSLPSIGIRFAMDLISLGYYSLKDLKGKDPVKILARYEQQVGAWVDPCVEDQFRLVVYYAQHPESNRNWWDFTAERKKYREQHGYPSSRPKRPWYELPQFMTSTRIGATKSTTKEDLHGRLKRSIAYMKKELANKVTIRRLADVAALSQYHYIRNFKSAYDITPAQFLTRLRLKKASLLLKKSELGLDEIVHTCGFDDKSSFIRLFRKSLRTTPMQYRKEHGLKKETGRKAEAPAK